MVKEQLSITHQLLFKDEFSSSGPGNSVLNEWEEGGKGLVRLLLGNVQLRNPKSAWYHENGIKQILLKAFCSS